MKASATREGKELFAWKLRAVDDRLAHQEHQERLGKTWLRQVKERLGQGIEDRSPINQKKRMFQERGEQGYPKEEALKHE